MSAQEVEEYLRAVDEPKRSTLQALRRTIRDIVPDAEEGISYRVPAFRLNGKTVAGFASFKDHVSYLPFSGSVLGQLADELTDLHDDQELSPLRCGPNAAEVTGAEADRSASH